MINQIFEKNNNDRFRSIKIKFKITLKVSLKDKSIKTIKYIKMMIKNYFTQKILLYFNIHFQMSLIKFWLSFIVLSKQIES